MVSKAEENTDFEGVLKMMKTSALVDRVAERWVGLAFLGML